MPIAPRLNQFINDQGVICQLIHHAHSGDYEAAVAAVNIDKTMAAKVIPLIDVKGAAVAVVSLDCELDIDKLNSGLGRSFQVLNDSNASKLFSDCETGAFPVFAMAYGLPVVLDTELMAQDYVVSPSGCNNALIKVPQQTFSQIMRGAIKARIGQRVTATLVDCVATADARSEAANDRPTVGLVQAAEKLDKLYKLPPMPDTAVKILHLTADEEASIQDLAALIEKDPSLTAQIMRYARSALFNYRGDLTCIREAVNIVLGFDRVAQLAMGLAASEAFNVQSTGPFGLKSFWKHSLHCAVLTQALALMATPDLELDEREAYLAGMLHNFGLLLIGHLFPPEFRMLNKLRQAEPEASMRQLEEQVFGMGGAQEFITMGHGTIGAILLKMWGLPESTVKAAGMHQNMKYSGEHEHYVRLVQLSNALLSRYDIGDEVVEIETHHLMQEFGLDPEKVDALLDVLVEQCSSLDGMIQSMAA